MLVPDPFVEEFCVALLCEQVRFDLRVCDAVQCGYSERDDRVSPIVHIRADDDGFDNGSSSKAVESGLVGGGHDFPYSLATALRYKTNRLSSSTWDFVIEGRLLASRYPRIS